MRKCLKVAALIAAAVMATSGVKAQIDPHFSQYYVYPSFLNPAMTGVFDGDYRITGIYRTQWGNVSAPFKTPGVAFDMNTGKSLNFGASVMTQQAGEGGYRYTTAYGSVSYTGIRFGAQGFQRLVFGMQAGIIQRRFDVNKLTFGSQWSPVLGFNATNASNEILSKTSATSFDAGAGVLYYDAQPGKKVNLYAGYSVAHLTRPDDQFSSGSATKDKIPMRHTIHAGARINLSETFSLTPNALYLRQATAKEIMVGAYGQLKAAANTDFLFGANYRFEDAISPYVGFYYKNIVIGASYDINNSDLGKMVNGANSFEISFSLIGRKTTKTPEAEFVCPRL
jgi:type IX secretion system PorP/SprF family membrane protein